MKCPRCEAPILFRIGEDSDGDAQIPGGVRTWITAELDERFCDCELTEEEWQTLDQAAAKASYHSSDYGADY